MKCKRWRLRVLYLFSFKIRVNTTFELWQFRAIKKHIKPVNLSAGSEAYSYAFDGKNFPLTPQCSQDWLHSA